MKGKKGLAGGKRVEREEGEYRVFDKMAFGARIVRPKSAALPETKWKIGFSEKKLGGGFSPKF